MTKQQAKELSLEVWGYLRDRSYIADKSDLPQELYRKIYFLTSRCLLCEILLFSLEKCCSGCPLENCGAKSLWWEWDDAGTSEERKKYAALIYDKIAAWKI